MHKLLTTISTLVAGIAVALPAQAAPAAQTIRVTERDYSIALSAKPRAGKVTFLVKNAGDDPHNFYVRGGGRTFKSRVVGEGGSLRLSATLKKGVRYQYWCAVGSHASKGMRGSFVAR